MNGNRRPNNLSRMNYHDGRSSSYQDHRQCYHDHRHSSHECRHDNRPQSHDVRHEHRPHDSRPHENRPSAPQHVPQSPVYSQHEELVKFVHDAWSKVEMDNGSNNIAYYEETEGCQVKVSDLCH